MRSSTEERGSMAKKEKKAVSSGVNKAVTEQQSMIGPKMNFASAEAYKLLRTNVMFSFSDANESHILGMTSSLRGEGKSLTSINLAYTFAETGKEILLIEADMRLPTLANRLSLSAKPGLSNVLVGTDSVAESIQTYSVMTEGRKVSLDVLVSGDIPPNPSELLGSPRTAAFLKKAKEKYDYIIVDLPPVTAVTDAIIVSHLVDGMIVVVRADHAVRSSVAETMRQLKLADAHVLGFVFNGATETEGKYYKKSYYRSDYYSDTYGAEEDSEGSKNRLK